MKFSFYCDVWNVRYWFYFGAPDEQCRKFFYRIRDYNHDEFTTETERAKGVCFMYLSSDCAIWMPIIPTTPGHHGTLAHEIAHAVYFTLRKNGVIMGGEHNDADEAFAYLTGYLTRKVYQKLLK